MKRSDAAEWDVACEDEIRMFQQMGVYDVVPRPDGRKVIGSKWVFRIKRGPDGQVQKYKARIVAQGFTQVEGLDYNQTFAPVVKLSTFHAILAIAAQQNLTTSRSTKWTSNRLISTAKSKRKSTWKLLLASRYPKVWSCVSIGQCTAQNKAGESGTKTYALH